MNGKKLCRLINENLLYPIVGIITNNKTSPMFIKQLAFSVDVDDLKITHINTASSSEISKMFGLPISKNVDYMSIIKITTDSKSNIKTFGKFLLFGLSEEMGYTVGSETWYICETRLIDATTIKLRGYTDGVTNVNDRRFEIFISIGFRKEYLTNKPKPISI